MSHNQGWGGGGGRGERESVHCEHPSSQANSQAKLTVKLVLNNIVEYLQQEEDQMVVGGICKHVPWGGECLQE